VRAILGKPALIRPRAQIANGIGVPEFRYGGTTQATFGLSITFIKRGTTIVARSLYFQAPALVDRQLGHILRLQPLQLQQSIEKTYGSQLRRSLAYGSSPFSVGRRGGLS
jgi:hypothetical protein